MTTKKFEVPILIYSITAQRGTVEVTADSVENASEKVVDQISHGTASIEWGKVISDETTEITLDGNREVEELS